MSGLAQALRLGLEVIAGEGVRAFADRVTDRLAERRRVAALDPDPGAPLPQCPVVNLSPLPPRPNRGGSQLQMLHRLDTEARERPVALLYPIAGGWRLEVRSGDRGWRRDLGPAAAAAASGWAGELCSTSLVHLENLHGLALETGAEITRAGQRLILGVHDFTAFCRRPHLLERPGLTFCDYSRDDERCQRCLAAEWPVEPDGQARYRALAAASLSASTRVVFPSAFLRDRYLELFPTALDEARAVVVEPTTARHPGAAPAPTGDHVAFVGGAKAHKGGHLLAPVAAAVRRRRPGARFTSFGEGDAALLRHLRGEGIRVRGFYRAGTLGGHLLRDRVRVAVFPSIWPESYGLVADECLAVGVPVVVFDHGAVGERVRRLGCGRAAPLSGGAEALAEAVLGVIHDDLRVPTAATEALPSPTTAAADLARLYRELGSV